MRMIDEVGEGCFIEEVWRKWKEKVLAAAEKGIGRKRRVVVRRGRKTNARNVAYRKSRGAKKRGEEKVY